MLFCCGKVAKSAALIWQSMPCFVCQVCFEFAPCKRCGCGGGLYCSVACQKQDWCEHRQYCEIANRFTARKPIWEETGLPNDIKKVVESFLRGDVREIAAPAPSSSSPPPSSPAVDNGSPVRRWGRHPVATLPARRWRCYNRWRRYPPEID